MAAKAPDGTPIDPVENLRRMQNGESYYAFTPDLIAARRRCIVASKKFNNADDMSRREMAELWREYVVWGSAWIVNELTLGP